MHSPQLFPAAEAIAPVPSDQMFPTPITGVLEDFDLECFTKKPVQTDASHLPSSSGDRCPLFDLEGPFDPVFALPPSNSVLHDPEQPNVIDSAAVHAVSHSGAGPSSSLEALIQEDVHEPLLPFEASPVSYLSLADSPLPAIKKPRNGRGRNPSKAPNVCSSPVSKAPMSSSPPQAPTDPLPPRPRSSRRNPGRRRKRVPSLDDTPIVDEVAMEARKAYGDPDVEVVQAEFERRVQHAKAVTECHKIKERERLRDVDADSGDTERHVKASRREARLSRIRKNTYIASLEDELKDVIATAEVYRQCYLKSRPTE